MLLKFHGSRFYTNPLQERLWSKVRTEGDCWIWLSRLNASGYGTIKVSGRSLLAHRVAFELTYGYCPPELDHICQIKACIRPTHLRETSHIDNMQNLSAESRMGMGSVNGSKMECPQGHQYTPDNTYVSKGGRKCKTCVKARVMLSYYNNRDEINARRTSKRKGALLATQH